MIIIIIVLVLLALFLINIQTKKESQVQSSIYHLNDLLKKKQKEFDEICDKIEQMKEKYSQESLILSNEILEATNKRNSYIREIQDKEKVNSSNLYSLNVSEKDKKDIHELRECQKRISNYAVIDKMIWEGYYKPAYEKLQTHLFKNKTDKISGVYIITDNMTGKVYIGQSVNIRDRLRTHIKKSLERDIDITGNKLYSSMSQDGLENFSFRIIEKVAPESLNEREKFWIDFYKSNEYGLNSTKGNS